jgi:signal transduction histidine kinase
LRKSILTLLFGVFLIHHGVSETVETDLKTLASTYYELDKKDSSAGLVLRQLLKLSLEENQYDSLAKYSILFYKHPTPGMNNNTEEAEVLRQAASFGAKIKDPKLRGTVHLKLAGALFDLSNFEAAIPEYTEALETFEPEDSILIADSYFFRGQAHDTMGSLIQAMKDYQTANEIYEKLGKQDYQNFTLAGIAVLYSKFSLYDEAEQIRNQLQEYYRESGSLIGLAIQQYNQAEDYRKNGRLDLEKETLLAIDQQLPLEERYLYFEAIVPLKLAIIFAHEGDRTKLDFYLKKAEKLIALEPDITNENVIYLAAQYWNKSFQADLNEANRIAKQTLVSAKASNEMDYIILAYQNLIHSFEKLGDYQNAFNYLNAYKTYQDSLFVVNRASTFSYYQTSFETEKKEREIAIQTFEIERIKIENQAQLRWLFLLILIITGAGIAIFFWKNLKESRKKALMTSKFAQELLKNQETERIRISKDLHDGLGQSLLLIKNKVRLNHDIPTGELLDTAISELRSIARSLHPMQLEKLGLEKAIKMLLDQVDQETDLFVSSELEDLGKILTKEKELHIYRIFQESLNNILKHAEASAMKVYLTKKGNSITLSVSDNGKGFDFSEKYNDFKSLGLKTLKERIGSIQGTMKVSSEKGKGTTLSFIVNATG